MNDLKGDCIQGFYNRILNIDLTKKEFQVQDIKEKIYKKYLVVGG